VSNLAYLSIGSNIHPEQNLLDAVKLLKQYGQILAVSSIWETAPAVFSEQANFLNAALLLETDLSVVQLRNEAITEIESTLKRVRTENKHGPRTIDIDITLFNQLIIDLGTRHIPDNAILKFAYVAIPLAEIAPNYIHPETGQTILEIAQLFVHDPALISRKEDIKQLIQSIAEFR
jgi:2-amino-4-hydroxy-6-hydroxymethyldihydropteridine diphosphokinase